MKQKCSSYNESANLCWNSENINAKKYQPVVKWPNIHIILSFEEQYHVPRSVGALTSCSENVGVALKCLTDGSLWSQWYHRCEKVRLKMDRMCKPLRKAVCSKAFSLKKSLTHSLSRWPKISLALTAKEGCTFSC